MKLLIITLTVLSSFFTKPTYASDDVSPVVLKAFAQSFTAAKDVSWTSSKTFYKATFELNDQYVSAFYNEEGELIAVTRNVTALQMPAVLQAELKKDYTSYWITDLFEITNEQGTYYYVTLETADSKIVLKSTSFNKWSTYKKSQKS
ncbi:MAG: hypothetical protein ICV66_08700 [Chitinophagaceae bacterium]|nr:hypothetical protein [Chitinophagaceae bacterium]